MAVPSSPLMPVEPGEAPLAAKALLLLLLKEGLQGVAKVAQLLSSAVEWAVKHALEHRAEFNGLLKRALEVLAKLPGGLQSAFRVLWSSRIGKAILAALTSIACFKLRWGQGAGNNSGMAGAEAANGLQAQVSSSLSLLFGLIR